MRPCTPVPSRRGRGAPAPPMPPRGLALGGSGVPAIFALIAVALSGGRFAGTGWLLVVVPILLVAALLAGSVLVFTGWSWLALALPAGVLTALVLFGYLEGGRAGGAFGVLTLGI